MVAISPILVVAAFTLWLEFKKDTTERISLERQKLSSKKSRARIENEFPLVVELFAVLLAGNMSPATALFHLNQNLQGEFAGYLQMALDRLQNGATLTSTLDELSSEVGSPTVRRFCDSLLIALERGSPLVDVVNRQVEEIRNEQKSRLLAGAGKAEIALMIPVVFLILPISVLFALWPSYVSLGNGFG
jgi:tight adherence protein C